ncbi:YdeI/OmpD-associated family protein [Ekhidna sp.]
MATFFPEPNDFRKWLMENHEKKTELWVGYYKKATGKPSVTWPDTVDQALCFGWIDGIRRKLDDEAYQVRFTPRKPNSHWSHVNIRKIKELKKEKLLMPAGIAAYQKRKPENSGNASFEQKNVKLSKAYESQLKANKKAWNFFYEKLAPSYRKQSIWWVMSAKREETREKRLNILIKCSSQEDKVPPLKWTK